MRQNLVWNFIRKKNELSDNSNSSFYFYQQEYLALTFLRLTSDYNCGPEGINALASSLSQYCSKFLMYLAASDFALVSHSATSA